MYFQQTFFRCARCGKVLKKGEKEYAEKTNYNRCAECLFHEANGTDTIEKYNEWLRRG